MHILNRIFFVSLLADKRFVCKRRKPPAGKKKIVYIIIMVKRVNMQAEHINMHLNKFQHIAFKYAK